MRFWIASRLQAFSAGRRMVVAAVEPDLIATTSISEIKECLEDSARQLKGVEIAD
jgi:hypothetical protein